MQVPAWHHAPKAWPEPSISGITEPSPRGTESLRVDGSCPMKCDMVGPVAGMLPAFSAALPALVGLLQDLQGLCLMSRVMPSSRLQVSPWLPSQTTPSEPWGLRLSCPTLRATTSSAPGGRLGGERQGLAQGVGGERGAAEVKEGFGVGRARHGAGGGKHPWLCHPSVLVVQPGQQMG